MKAWKVFIFCHNVIWDEMYEGDPGFSPKNYTFLKLGNHYLHRNISKDYKVIAESDFPISWPSPFYAEITGMYCVYKNNLHRGLDYVGFSHYDKEHRLIGSGGKPNIKELEALRIQSDMKQQKLDRPTNITALINEKLAFHCPVHVSLESHDFKKIYSQRVLMDESQPDAFVGDGINCIDRILDEYNSFFRTSYTLTDVAKDGFLNMCDCFITPVPLFEKLMSFLVPIIETRKLDFYDSTRSHRLQGGLLERYVAVFFALEEIEKIDLSIVHHYSKKLKREGSSMNYGIEKLISRTFLYDIVTDKRHKKELLKWVENNRPCPPPHLIKQSVVKDYARRFSIKTLVETGTYLGFMIRATRDIFSRIYSIELDEVLYQRAAKKFSKYKHVKMLQGDSGEVLKNLMGNLSGACLFWLDAHHSSGATFTTGKGKKLTPIVSELEHILHQENADDHVILIDDAREFTGENDYPTLQELEKLVKTIKPQFVMSVQDDIIRIHRGAQ